VWKKQDEHQYFHNQAKLRYTKFSFLADDDIKVLVRDNIKLKPKIPYKSITFKKKTGNESGS
jgi:hypothetical protein